MDHHIYVPDDETEEGAANAGYEDYGEDSDCSNQRLIDEEFTSNNASHEQFSEVATGEDEQTYASASAGPSSSRAETGNGNFNWDVFKMQPHNYQNSIEFWNRMNVFVRVTLCCVFFILLLATASLSKFMFLVTVYNVNLTRSVDQQGNHEISVNWLWAVILTITTPYFFTVVRNTSRMIFKRNKKPLLIPLIVAFLMETIHTIGLCLFVFFVAPAFNPVIVLLLSQGVGIVPSFCKLFWTKSSDQVPNSHETFSTALWRTIAFLSFGLQVGFVAVTTWILSGHTIVTCVVLIPVSLLFISLRWWDNFIQIKKVEKVEKWWTGLYKKDRNRKPDSEKSGQFILSLSKLAKAINAQRTVNDLVVSLWKIALTLIIPAVFIGAGGDDCAETFRFQSSRGTRCGLLPGYNITLIHASYENCGRFVPYVTAVIGLGTSLIGYLVAKSACKIRSQVGCFSVPLSLSTPLTFVIVLVSFTDKLSVQNLEECGLYWFRLPPSQDTMDLLKQYCQEFWFPIVIAGFVSLLLICTHVWIPTAGRVEATEVLFSRPLYCGAFFDVSLMMNRRTDDSLGTKRRHKHVYRVPKVCVCVTMWHETPIEMVQVLKSILRLDRELSSRNQAQELSKITHEDFYTMEAHIIFDNAFNDKEEENPFMVNKYVVQFISSLDKAIWEMYSDQSRFREMKSSRKSYKYVTPYGGRLEWCLPGGHKLSVHLKDKEKIRIKKRWSQVMYMYYLMHKDIITDENIQNKKSKKAAKESEHYFVLTLDGDVDFQPVAVDMFLDRMKKNRDVGAVCGRIHPEGSGPLVWYQKFEYAMSHWLQKATEHVTGCVLCSPGAFSMFRASALMSDNVLRKYAEVSDNAKQYIQFDQGEDRWLCTLLLQSGHRIEYCAAADAKTYAPESFNEFYNQRRRWTPSTMANVLDVLTSSSLVRANNNDISLLYILYQGFMFLSAVLTPGTIFLLVFSAINTAYPQLELYAAMLLNLIPVLVYIILIFTAKPDIQLKYASILSVLYALVMMVVFVGIFKQIVESQFCSMSAAFFLFVVGVFLVTALLHPQEFTNVIHGFVYFLAIPSMSMLLMFYALGNLDQVSWGTREENRATQVNNSKDLKGKGKMFPALMNFVKKIKDGDKWDSDYIFSFGGLFRCICCPTPREQTIGLLMEKMEDLEHAVRHPNDHYNDDPEIEQMGPRHIILDDTNSRPFSQTPLLQTDDTFRENPAFVDEIQYTEMDEYGNMRWLNDPNLNNLEEGQLRKEDDTYWKGLIGKYLKPFQVDEAIKAKKQKDLTELRNTACSFFFLANAVFVTLMFILESVSEYTPSLVFHLPCDVGSHGATREPVAIAFTLIFGMLLLIQFLCMLKHRYSTLLAIASITRITQQVPEQKAKEQMAKKLLQLSEALDYEVNEDTRSIVSIASSEATIDDRHNQTNYLMKRLFKDAVTVEQEDPGNVDNNFLDIDFRRRMGKLHEILDCAVDESAEQVKQRFPGLSNQSFYAIVEAAKDKEKRNLIKSVAAKQNWDIIRSAVSKEPALVRIVGQMKHKSQKSKKAQFKLPADETDQTLDDEESIQHKSSTNVPTEHFQNHVTRGNTWKHTTSKILSLNRSTGLVDTENEIRSANEKGAVGMESPAHDSQLEQSRVHKRKAWVRAKKGVLSASQTSRDLKTDGEELNVKEEDVSRDLKTGDEELNFKEEDDSPGEENEEDEDLEVSQL